MRVTGHSTNPTALFRADVSCSIQQVTRLRELHRELTACRTALAYTWTGEHASPVLSSDPQRVRDALTKLKLLSVGSVLRANARDALADLAISGWVRRATVPRPEITRVESVIAPVVAHVDELLDSLQAILAEAPSIAVQLPNTTSLDELVNNLSLLNSFIVRPAHDWLGIGVEFSGVDRGSVWIEVAIATAIVATAGKNTGLIQLRELIEALTDGAIKISKETTRRREFAEALRHTEEAHRAAEELEKAETALRTKQLRALADLIAKDQGEADPDTEKVGRLIHAIEAGEKLFSKGARTELALPLATGDTPNNATATSTPDAVPAQLPEGEKK